MCEDKHKERHTMKSHLIGALALLAFSSPAIAKPAKLLDVDFAQELCKGWNKTSLPAKLGRAGSGWIDSADSKGKQTVVINRRDCKAWKKVQLVIEANDKGEAMCTSAGAASGKFQWKFEPTTEQWADFTDGFGALKMPGIMKGFVGPYGTAMKNIGNFEVFFALAGYIALQNNVSWACEGADAEDVKEEVADIDQGDMKATLKGMAILK